MAKLAVITDRALAPGFAMAGVDVYSADSAAEARRILLTLMGEPDVGVIAVYTAYLSALDAKTRRRVDQSCKPVVVAIPSGVPTEAGERRSEEIAEMIRRAIGFRIRFRQGER